MERALKLESAALIAFYAKLENRLVEKREKIYEHEVPVILNELRSQIGSDQYLNMNSFPMILGSGANGAIVHYRAEEGSSLMIDPNQPLLCDTGAQYLTGTTDTTRTFLFKEPETQTPDQKAFYNHLKEMYTRVLMGNLDFQTTNFPGGHNKYTYGSQIEAIARRQLWSVGRNFNHGLGHGVSCCGPVHEYPHYAVAKPGPGSPAIHLQEGMIITNEPGYYEEGQFGIRIENIMLIEKFKNSKEQLLSMRPLTLVPYCSKLIVKDLLEMSHKRAI